MIREDGKEKLQLTGKRTQQLGRESGGISLLILALGRLLLLALGTLKGIKYFY